MNAVTHDTPQTLSRLVKLLPPDSPARKSPLTRFARQLSARLHEAVFVNTIIQIGLTLSGLALTSLCNSVEGYAKETSNYGKFNVHLLIIKAYPAKSKKARFSLYTL